MIITYRTKTSFRFFEGSYTHLSVFIRENFRPERTFVSIFEDETKFRLLFDRSIVSLLEGQDTDTSFFPSGWIEERNFSGEFNLNITELLR